MIEEKTTENADEYRDEIIAISTRMINLVNYQSSLTIRSTLVRNYVRWDMKEEAKRMLDTLPSTMWNAQLPYLNLVKEEDDPHSANFVMEIISMTYMAIDQFLDHMEFSTTQKIEKRKIKLQILRLFNSLAGIEDVQDMDRAAFAYENINIAGLCCEIENKESALDHVEEAVQHAKHNDEFWENQEGMYAMPGPTTRNLSWILWEDELSKPCFDLLRNEERFKICIETLKSNSREKK